MLTERPEWTTSITILGVQLTIDCATELRGAIEQVLSPWSPSSGPEQPTVSARLRVVRDAAGGSLLTRDDGSVARVADEDALAVAVQDWIDETVSAAAAPLIPVHAGLVGTDAGVVLLPGRSGAGKTRLVSALVAAGARYGSDERAFLDDQGHAYPFPRHPVVRDATGVRRSVPRPSTAAILDTPRRLTLIVDVEYDAGRQWSVRRADSSEGLLSLLRHTPYHLQRGEAIPTPFVSAVAEAACFVGVRGDADAAAAAILDLLRRQTPS